MKTALMITIIVFSTAASDVLIARGARRVRSLFPFKLREITVIARRIMSNVDLLSGVLMAAVSFFAFLIVLSWADLSLVLPATSLSYVIATLGSKIILRERINRLRWTGTFFVCAGVALISLP
jgi:drug/metabolite transporter (DMT)-like permease